MINVTISKKEIQNIEPIYPRLMIRKDQELVVVFTSSSDGIVLNGGTSPYKDFESVGGLGLSWFEDFKSSITLQNNPTTI
jgi:hypothetical protein